MKNLFLLFAFLGSYAYLTACCIGDNRMLSQRILEKKPGNIVWCRALHDANSTREGEYITKMEVIKVFFGKTDTSWITLRSGSPNSSVSGTFIKKDTEWLVFDGGGSLFYGGTICDRFFCETSTNKGKAAIEMLTIISDYVNNKKSGAISIKYPNGRPAIVGNFVEGIMDGEWKLYGIVEDMYADNRIFVNHYKMGKFYGEQLAFYGINQLKARNYYENAQLQGEAINYHSNGKTAAIKYYEKGYLVGEEKTFADNGNIQTITQYKEAKIIKTTSYFPKISGRIQSEYTYTYNDTLNYCFVKEYTEEGSLVKQQSSESKYKNGEHIGTYFEGEYVCYYPNTTQIKEKGMRHLGKKIGVWIKYNTDGSVQESQDFSEKK